MAQRGVGQVWLLIALAALAVGAMLVWATAREVAQPVAIAEQGYVQSDTCVRCHPSHYETWHDTYHRTMTQEASAEAVQGDFNDARYVYQGVTSRFTMQDGRYFMETLDTAGQMSQFEILRTVGSRRVQQYVTKIDDRYIRLPLAWNIEDGRWIHLNGGFLDPDGADFNDHLAIWDGNCIFCHNVNADPGYDLEAKRYDSSVAELGIACEACHGPGEAHIARNANPVRRYYLYLAGEHDPTIVNPTTLPIAQQVQTCGHCHGQRLPNPPERIREFFSEGDPYTAGEDLSQYTTPLMRDSHLEGVDITLRFWNDGTPRLSAYEYQGLLMSEGHGPASGLSCITCHNVHGGDPKGMIDEVMRGQEGCLQCHEEIRADVAAHTGHEATSAGSDCYACHMPNTTYGLIATHPSHHITSPDPSRAWQYQMPEACTLCHVDQSAPWAAQEWATMFDQPLPGDIPTSADFAVAEVIRALLAGDVVQRAVAAEALRDPDAYPSDDPKAMLWAIPFLLRTMEHDRYPTIRYFAYRAARDIAARAYPDDATLAALPLFDYLAPGEQRRTVITAWQQWWAALDKASLPRPGPAVPLDAQWNLREEIVVPLLESQSSDPVSIGE